MFKLFRRTDWKFVTSGGAEMSFGLSKFLFAGAAVGAFYARQGSSGPVYRLPTVAVLGGLGFGISAGGPVTVSVSLPFAAGGGYQIYQNPLRTAALKIDDFTGSFVQYSFGAGAGVVNRNVSLTIFGAPTWLVKTISSLPAVGMAARIPVLAASCHGVGVLWGSAITSAASAGLEVYAGEILTHMAPAHRELG